MKIIVGFLLLLTIIPNFKVINVFYGNNNHHLPCIIIEIDHAMNKEEIEELVPEIYKKYPEQKGAIRALLKYNNETYALAYADRGIYANKGKGGTEIIIHFYDTIKKQYSEIIDRFLSIQDSTSLKGHEIYGFYFRMGECSYLNYRHPGCIYIISKDTMGNYFYSYYLTKLGNIRSLTHLQGKFELETKKWQGLSKPAVKSKQILYETNLKDIVIQDLYYVDEKSEKYIEFLHRIKR